MTKFDPTSFLIRHLKKLSTPTSSLNPPPTKNSRSPPPPLEFDHWLQFLQMSKLHYIITNKLLNYDKCSSETAQNKLNLYKNSFCFRGASPPKPPPRALPLDLAGGAAPKPPIIASRYRARHWRMTTTYFTTTPLLVGTPSP